MPVNEKGVEYPKLDDISPCESLYFSCTELEILTRNSKLCYIFQSWATDKQLVTQILVFKFLDGMRKVTYEKLTYEKITYENGKQTLKYPSAILQL